MVNVDIDNLGSRRLCDHNGVSELRVEKMCRAGTRVEEEGRRLVVAVSKANKQTEAGLASASLRTDLI
jgi:hypothetical protein